jgi:formate-dependent phosphoribosylglycinamide formyltransferase (GAR transformylase)
MTDRIERFLCIASYEKGQDFLRQCAEMGVRPTLLTLDKLRDAAWPREVLEELVTIPSGLSREQILNTVSWMARGRRFDRIAALDEFDLETAAQIREHMRIPGMGITTATYYRDKLAMRTSAQESGFLVPEYCRVLNYDELRAYMDHVPPPWLLKPRSEASSLGIRKIEEPEQLWRALQRGLFRGASIRPAAHAGDARGRSLHHPHRGPRQPRLDGADRPERFPGAVAGHGARHHPRRVHPRSRRWPVLLP